MTEMVLNMSNVRRLVAIWQQNAISANNTQFKKDLAAGIENYLVANKEVANLIDCMQQAADTVNNIREDMNELTDRQEWTFKLPANRSYKDAIFDYEEGNAKRAFPFLQVLVLDHKQRESEISNEYKRLNELITGCRTAPKAKKMLASMGLDVSCLIEGKSYPVSLDQTPFNFEIMGLKPNQEAAEK